MTIKPIFRISVVLGLCLALVACESDKKGHPDMVRNLFSTGSPQLYANLDRERCKDMGISISDV